MGKKTLKGVNAYGVSTYGMNRVSTYGIYAYGVNAMSGKRMKGTLVGAVNARRDETRRRCGARRGCRNASARGDGAQC